ncbi:MAG TPA: hypothetical protein VGK67_27965 [Myxococcales bacterium]|jgi:hypothetical protein
MRLAPFALAIALTLCSQPSAAMVISEFYASGGKAGATYDRDYVLLRNTGAVGVELSGWSFQHYKTGQGWKALPLGPALLAPGGTYLVRLYFDQGTAEGAPLPNVDLVAPDSPDWNLSTTNGEALALVDSTVVLASCSDSSIVDLVGYNAGAPCDEGGTIAPTTELNQASRRLNEGTQDTNDNGADFALAGPLGLPRADAGWTWPDASAPGEDAAQPGTDAAQPGLDAASPKQDAAAVPEDATLAGPDATAASADAAAAQEDAGPEGSDAASSLTDTGSSPSDAGPTATDGGSPGEEPGSFEVGCSCGSVAGTGLFWLLLAPAVMSLPRRARDRAG